MVNDALLLQHRRDREDQQQVGNRAEHAVEPVEHVVDPASVVAGERAQHRADEHGDERRGEPDEDRRLRALDRLRDDVAAPFVGAEGQRRAALLAPRRPPLAPPGRLRMSFITSASGSTTLLCLGAADAGIAAVLADLAVPRCTSASGSTTVELNALPGVGPVAAGSHAPGGSAAGVGASEAPSGPRRRRVVDADLLRPVLRDQSQAGQRSSGR